MYDALEGASGPSELYEPMVRSYSENERKGDSYMTLKNGAWQEVRTSFRKPCFYSHLFQIFDYNVISLL